ncbi:MAG: NAD(P)-dependent oxidoreductase [Planctomycetia bacterium]|nr:NAD(P)-dependent oxidoreductase [Planctomycetia bacterium]
MRIGWIGTGIMGGAMVARLLAAGHTCVVFSRTKGRAENLLAAGAVWADSPRRVAEACDVVFTMVGFPTDVEEVILNPETGVLRGFQETGAAGKMVVDMTTSRPSLAKRIFEAAAKIGVSSLDAPVSGGDVGAKNGTLSIMVGGTHETFEKLADVWEILGKTVQFQGAAGAGQHTKMVNQILIAGNMMGVCEALRYAKKAGLDTDTVLASVATGAAGSWSLSHLGPRILNGDFAPGFRIRHFVKDLRIALEEADAMELDLPGTTLAKRLYELLQDSGHGDDGTQALYLGVTSTESPARA